MHDSISFKIIHDNAFKHSRCLFLIKPIYRFPKNLSNLSSRVKIDMRCWHIFRWGTAVIKIDKVQ